QVGVRDVRAAKRNDVRAALRNRLLCSLERVAHVARKRRRPSGVPSSNRGARTLKRVRLRLLVEPKGKAVHHLNTADLERRRQLDRSVERLDVVSGALAVVRAVGAEANPHTLLGNLSNDRSQHLLQEAQAVLDRAAVRVRALVRAGLDKLVDQVPVGAVQLCAAARHRSPPRGSSSQRWRSHAQCRRSLQRSAHAAPRTASSRGSPQSPRPQAQAQTQTRSAGQSRPSGRRGPCATAGKRS
ncbi:Hypothetical protein, putative, partial [Bodo saltans]